MPTIVNENLTKLCQVHLPVRVNHQLKDIQKERELRDGSFPSIASLIVEILEECLEARKINQQTA